MDALRLYLFSNFSIDQIINLAAFLAVLGLIGFVLLPASMFLLKTFATGDLQSLGDRFYRESRYWLVTIVLGGLCIGGHLLLVPSISYEITLGQYAVAFNNKAHEYLATNGLEDDVYSPAVATKMGLDDGVANKVISELQSRGFLDGDSHTINEITEAALNMANSEL